MQDNLYKEIILEHWRYPLHFGILSNKDIDVTEQNYSCGDTIHVTIKLQQKRLVQVLFTSESCVIAKAYASFFLDFIKGKTIQEVEKISAKDVFNLVGAEVSTSRVKCALLCYNAVCKGIREYIITKQ